ncbi:CRISPR-associated endoribonuclease Cas6 [Paenibacillus sp. NAIST15-1]|nr:CRISPR-associated endoribonuclease Cas6 [Paenibacillus sp. NAIST15-1]
MRIKITLTFDGKLTVPINHQEWLHGLIYHSIRDDEYRERKTSVPHVYFFQTEWIIQAR